MGLTIQWPGAGGGGGGGNSLYKPYRFVPPHQVGFLCRFGLKMGIRFADLVWNLVWFSMEPQSL